MNYRRTPIEAEIAKYEIGKHMEDGFELLADVVTKGWIVTDFLVKIERDNGDIVCHIFPIAEDVRSLEKVTTLF